VDIGREEDEAERQHRDALEHAQRTGLQAEPMLRIQGVTDQPAADQRAKQVHQPALRPPALDVFRH
jgi:hypothetical protein